MIQPNRKTKYEVPYRIYTLPDFYRLGSMGIWPGANVEGIGYVHQARSIPKYISIYLSKGKTARPSKSATVLDQVNMGLLVSGITAGGVEFGKLGSLSYRYKGVLNPAYYKYNANLGGGWGGGSKALIKTNQISGELGYGNMAGRYVAYAGIGINGYLALEAYGNDDKIAFRKAIADLIMTRVGMMGLPGFIIGSAYFLIDPFNPDKKYSEMKNDELIPRDNLNVNKKIMTLEEQEQMRIRQLNRVERPVIKPKF